MHLSAGGNRFIMHGTDRCRGQEPDSEYRDTRRVT